MSMKNYVVDYKRGDSLRNWLGESPLYWLRAPCHARWDRRRSRL